jgi:hypothetical protein
MREEKMRVLKMLEDHKITAEDAARLLDALPCEGPAKADPQENRRIRVQVTDPRTGKQTVNLTVPIGLAKFAVRFIPAKTKQDIANQGIDIDTVMSKVMSEHVGKVVDVESEGANVQISIE